VFRATNVQICNLLVRNGLKMAHQHISVIRTWIVLSKLPVSDVI